MHNSPTLPLVFPQPSPGSKPSPAPALPAVRENLLHPAHTALDPGLTRSPLRSNLAVARWAENEGLDVGKDERMLSQGLSGGWVMEERRLWTTAFPAPSRGRLGKQERKEKSI